MILLIIHVGTIGIYLQFKSTFKSRGYVQKNGLKFKMYKDDRGHDGIRKSQIEKQMVDS